MDVVCGVTKWSRLMLVLLLEVRTIVEARRGAGFASADCGSPVPCGSSAKAELPHSLQTLHDTNAVPSAPHVSTVSWSLGRAGQGRSGKHHYADRRRTVHWSPERIACEPIQQPLQDICSNSTSLTPVSLSSWFFIIWKEARMSLFKGSIVPWRHSYQKFCGDVMCTTGTRPNRDRRCRVS